MARTPVKPAGRKPASKSTTKATTQQAPRSRPPRKLVVMVATRKGAWLFHSDARRKAWRVDGPHFR